MGLRVIGAGVGRTGTESLRQALEQLLGGRCYHMFEIIAGRRDHVPVWLDAARGEYPAWDEFLADYVAAVDWPAASFWPELLAANPDALVLLSVRDVDAWWASARATIFSPRLEEQKGRVGFPPEWPDAVLESRFDPRWREEGAAKEAYLRHNDAVRSAVPAGQLLEWAPGDGWEPICDALGVAVPDGPFPHANTSADFQRLPGAPS